MPRHRLSICYVVAGHHLLPTAGPTRNVLSLARALSKHADVTVAFRKQLGPFNDPEVRVIELEESKALPSGASDDAAVRGVSLKEFWSYLSALRRFIATELVNYDVVLEKSWLLSGYFARPCRLRGISHVLVENVVPVWNHPRRTLGDWSKYAKFKVAQHLVGRYLKDVPMVLAETEELRAALEDRWPGLASRVRVVGLGVDYERFRPLDQENARRQLGVNTDRTILLYSGVLDRTHNLRPVLEALRTAPARFELHVLGDGGLRAEYESLATACEGRVRFHGRVPHETVPQFIAAADACLAPYDEAAFHGGPVAYSTLKIPEYMAGARAVLSVPSGHINELITSGTSGYLFSNTVESWSRWLAQCPTREELRRVGKNARETLDVPGWDDVAQAYLALCEEARGQREGRTKSEEGSRSRQ